MAKTLFSQISYILHYVEDLCGIWDLIKKTLPVCVSPGLRFLQVWRAADPQVAAARLPRHAGPRDRLV